MLSTLLTVALATVSAGKARQKQEISEKFFEKTKLPKNAMEILQEVKKLALPADEVAIVRDVARVRSTGTVAAGSIGWIQLTSTEDGSCSGPTANVYVQFGVCVTGETLTDSSASQFITYNGQVNGDMDSFTSDIYSTPDCSGAVLSTEDMTMPKNQCVDGMTYNGVEDSFSPPDGYFSLIEYNSASECNGGSYDDVINAYALPLGKCFSGTKYSCSTVTYYFNIDCSGISLPLILSNTIYSYCFDDDDFYGDDYGDDDFEPTDTSIYSCSGAASLATPTNLAAAFALVAAWLW